MGSDSIIAVKDLVKRFKEVVAVDGISFEIDRGEMFAFLGPNGAGKSTTIKMLITLLAPTSGEASIDGLNIVADASDVRRIIGYVPQLISVDGTLTAYENLMLMARLYDIPRNEREARIAEVLGLLNLADHASALVRTFSGGMIRRLEIGQAILHHPKVLFLDEPTSGLDPVARQNVWKHIRELRDQYNTTILFSTHQMEEAEEECDRVAIMNAGKIATIGTVPEIKSRTNKENATLEDAFIFFTGAELEDTSNFRSVRQTRRTEHRLG